MRLLHVMPGVSPRFGSPRNLIAFIRCLIDCGVDATLLTTDADADGHLDVPLNRVVIDNGVPHIFHHVWRVGGRYGFAPAMVRTLRRTMATCDLVHIHWLYNFSCIAAARAALAAGVPYVVQPHGSLDPHLRRRNRAVKDAYMATVGRPLLRRAAAAVFDTAEEARLAEYAPRRPEWIIPAGVNAAEFDRLPPRGTFRAAFPAVSGPYLLFLSRVSPQKGLDLLLPAFARIAPAHPDLQLVIAGPDYRGYEADMRALAAQLGLGRRVVFTGMLPHDLKLAAFVDADLFVLPSYAENFGVVVMEALFCGLPVMISDQVNMHGELAAAGVATVVQCRIDSVAAGMATALADAAGRARIAAEGPAFVKAQYTWEAIAPAAVDWYRDVISSARAGGGHPDALQ